MAALDVEAKLVRVRLALKVFNPFQPRVPAGTRQDGQWAGDGTGDRVDDGSSIQPVAGRERDRISGAELATDPDLNRHIVDGHVGRTDAEMIERRSVERGFRIISAYPRNDDDENENKSGGFVYAREFKMNLHWKEFCEWFHQDCHIVGDSWGEIVAFNISYRSRENALKIRDFLDDVLSKNLSDQELMDIWTQSPAEIYIKEKEYYRVLYKGIRDTADRHVQGRLPISPPPDV